MTVERDQTRSLRRADDVGSIEPGSAIHLIGNAHMDPVWVWNWREGYGEVWATFRSALDRLAEYPEFIFTASSAAHHAWVEQQDPGMFEEIRAAVAAGRWRLVGGMWIEPDCNLPSGESLCRQLLLGQRYFDRAFDRRATIGYNIDSFGHSAGLPQILVRSGISAYVMMRPAEHERSLPGPAFIWTDVSGARLPTFRIPVDYATEGPEQLAERAEIAAEAAHTAGRPMMLFYGVGNHGGGPTRQILDGLGQLRSVFPALQFSDPERYFSDLAHSDATAPLPVVSGELQHHAVGCYSVSAWVKAAHARCERNLLDAEQLDTIASAVTHRPAHTDRLREAWEELLLCEFHDVLAGTSSESAYASIHDRFGYVETVADQVATEALYEIAHSIDTTGPTELVERESSFWLGSEGRGVPYLVYNPLSWPVRQVVTGSRSSDRVLNSKGEEIASQAVTSGEVTLFASHSLFIAELPAMGYEVFWLEGGRRRRAEPVDMPREPSISNGILTATIDPSSGAVASLRDETSGVEHLADGGIQLQVVSDTSDSWSHGVLRYDAVAIPLSLLDWEQIENGPIRQTIRIRFAWQDSLVTTGLSLADGMSYAELRIRADWRTPDVVLKLVAPWRLGPSVTTTAGAAYLFADRSGTGEEPMQGWVDAYSPTADVGVGITADQLYGYDADNATLRLTVLRNPLAADHGGGWSVRPGEDYPYTDAGRHDATVRFHPHAGDWRSAGMPARAAEHVRQPIAVADTYHHGSNPLRQGFVRIDPPDAAALNAVKRAEDGSGVVVRLVEQQGRSVTATLVSDLLGRVEVIDLSPYEVKTIMLPDHRSTAMREVLITEHPVERAAE